MNQFYGRKFELSQLKRLQQKKTASFIAISGRRRIGKSRLIKEFAKEFSQFYSFVGLAPTEKTTHQDQLREISRQISQQFNAPKAFYSDWSDALYAIGERVRKGKILLLFDEISWMGFKDHNFLGKIKNFWDLQLQQNNKLIFIICGSASSWIDKNILSNTGFVGRISYTLNLTELELSECSKFWPKNISNYEKLKILSITGGVPKYLEEIIPQQSAEENIKNLCLTKGGFLVDEFNKIFHDIFLRNSNYYHKILEVLKFKAMTIQQLHDILEIHGNGRLVEYLHELELAGFVTRDFSWKISTGAESKNSLFRLSDNYIRFYLYYIAKNLHKIQRNHFGYKSLSSLLNWENVIGLQFENLVLNHRNWLYKKLKLSQEDIIYDNPYFQRKTKLKAGCQIDYMIQTKFNTLYICEIKFSRNKIGMEVTLELESKIKALKVPKHFSFRPVLIHVGGISEVLEDSGYFAEVIDFSEILG